VRDRILVTALLLSLAGCQQPIRLKTIELQPTIVFNGVADFRAKSGTCLPAPTPPPGRSSGVDWLLLVGFDDWFDEGVFCDAWRVQIFRGGVHFDLSQFDASGIAVLKFELLASWQRSGSHMTVPKVSFATTIDAATHAFDLQMRADDSATLPGGPLFEVTVGSFVNDWITGARPNFGFVLAGPRGPIDPNNLPKDNDAQWSYYQNFRLAVTYNPALNPRAPQ
jgi:hypothetical protein